MSLQNLQIDFAELISNDQEAHLDFMPAKNILIYRNTILHHLISHLQNVYPLMVQLVGDDFFKIMAKEYIQRYPSRSGNLHDYGEYLSDFMIDYQPVKNLIYLPEVAIFEWICHGLYFAADHTPLDIRLLETFTPDQYDHLHVSLHPASCIKKFYHPILDIIDLCKGLRDSLEIDSEGIVLLIARRHFEIVFETLNMGEYIFLQSISDHMSISKALTAALAIDPKFNLEEKLPHWIQTNLIVEISN